MAKHEFRAAPWLSGLLTLKSELWQSVRDGVPYAILGLLTLKSELWQSAAERRDFGRAGLLTLKSELWQSCPPTHDRRA